MSDDNVLRIEIDASGAAKASAELQRVAKSVDATTEATKKNTTAVAAQAEKFKVGGVEVDKFGSSLGIAGQAIGRINGTAGAMVSTLGAATGAIQALTTAGLGPLGVAVTAANLAITLAVGLLGDQATASATAERETKTLLDRINELATSYENAAKQAADLARIQSGGGSVNEQRGALTAARQDAARIRAELRAAESGGPLSSSRVSVAALESRLASAEAAVLRAENQLEAVTRRERNASTMIEESGYEQIAQPRSARTSRGGGGSRASATPSLESLMGQMGSRSPFAAGAAGFDDMLRANEEREAEASALAIQAQKDRDAAIYEERMQSEQKITDMLAEEEDRRKSIAEEADAARIDSMQKTADAISAIGSTMTQIYGFIDDAGASADESEEQREKKRLKRLAFSQSIEAIVNAAQSVVSFARQDYVGGAMYAAASGLNIAAAAKAGIDAGNVPTQGASGGSAGSAMRNDSRSASSSSREPLTVVVNMNGPVIATADRAELGRQINSLANEGRGRYGE